MANSEFRSLQVDYLAGINASRNYIKNGLGLQGTTNYFTYNDAFLLTSTDTVGEAVNVRNTSTGTSIRPYVGQPLFYTGTTPSGGLTLNTIYYVASTPTGAGTTANPWYFQISATPGGSAINLTSTAGDNNSRFLPYTPMSGLGTAIAPSITFAVSSSSPLRGDRSFVFTKDAVNRLGQGTSYNFTIDSADQAKVMQIGFDYAVASGTYATGDVAVYIVDATNNSVIQPSAYALENVGVNSTARLTFQTASNSTSYRLCFHVASTSASAYSLKFDNITLGPQVVPMGAPVIDYTSTTPNWTNLGFSSTSINSLIWWRVGPTLFGRAMFRGSGGSGSASALVLAMPSGLTIDTTKVASTDTTEAVGFYKVYDDVGGASTGMGSVDLNSATNLVFRRNDSGTFATNSMTTSDRFTAEFSVPIVGWSSSTVVSSSADTRLVTARYTTTTAGSYGTGGAVLDFPIKGYDSHGAVTTGASWKFTAPVPGKYEVKVGLSPSGTNGLYAELYKNGAAFARLCQYRSGTNPPQLAGSTEVELNAGEYVNIVVFSETATTSLATASHLNFITVSMLQGPSQIAASEVIACRAYLSANQTGVNTNNSQVKINFNATTLDTHGGWNTSTYRYTAPAPGVYEVATTIYTSSANVLANTYHPAIYVNGAEVQYGHPVPSIASTATGGYANWIGQLNTGDYVEIYWYGAGNNSASTMTIFGPSGTKNSSVHIKRLGGI